MWVEPQPHTRLDSQNNPHWHGNLLPLPSGASQIQKNRDGEISRPSTAMLSSLQRTDLPTLPLVRRLGPPARSVILFRGIVLRIEVLRQIVCGDLARVRSLMRFSVRPAVERELQPMKGRSEEHTSELQSLMRISYAVFCLKKKKS